MRDQREYEHHIYRYETWGRLGEYEIKDQKEKNMGKFSQLAQYLQYFLSNEEWEKRNGVLSCSENNWQRNWIDPRMAESERMHYPERYWLTFVVCATNFLLKQVMTMWSLANRRERHEEKWERREDTIWYLHFTTHINDSYLKGTINYSAAHKFNSIPTGVYCRLLAITYLFVFFVFVIIIEVQGQWISQRSGKQIV